MRWDQQQQHPYFPIKGVGEKDFDVNLICRVFICIIIIYIIYLFSSVKM
jgi:hypothetical protein